MWNTSSSHNSIFKKLGHFQRLKIKKKLLELYFIEFKKLNSDAVMLIIFMKWMLIQLCNEKLNIWNWIFQPRLWSYWIDPHFFITWHNSVPNPALTYCTNKSDTLCKCAISPPSSFPDVASWNELESEWTCIQQSLIIL